MQETLQAIEAVGKIAGGSVGGAALTLFFLAAWAKRKGLLDIFNEKRENACSDPVCQANMLSRAERQADLEEHVYEVLTPKLTKIGEDVAFIRGKLS